MVYLLLTYDYELFFNKSFASEEEVLIQPTYEIAKALSSEGVPATFFVDTPSLITYRRHGLEEFPNKVKEQIDFLLNENHDVQLHIHPIWFQAGYKNSEWVFNNDYYSLKSFSNVKDIIEDSKFCLDELAGDNPNYHCCAFRAGGFCYSPVKEITEALLGLGIKIDSSVCKGLKMNTLAQQFDYTETPKDVNWFFDSDNMFRETNSSNKMFEIPIGTYRRIPNKWILTHCMPRLVFPQRKGLSTPTIDINRSTFFDRIKSSIITPVLFTHDSLHAYALEKIVKYFEKQAIDKDIYVALIAHPKLSSAICVANTISFVQLIKNNCHNTRFVSMCDVARIMSF